jgi:NtrC-family two-component system response regulator AlgB
VRELVNAVERAVILTPHPHLQTRDLPPHIADFRQSKSDEAYLVSLAEIEKKHIQEVLLHTPSLEDAARVLGINQTTLWRKRKQYHLD